MKTMADILRERGKLGPYTAGESADSPAVPAPDEHEQPRKRPRKTLPPVDF